MIHLSAIQGAVFTINSRPYIDLQRAEDLWVS